MNRFWSAHLLMRLRPKNFRHKFMALLGATHKVLLNSLNNLENYLAISEICLQFKERDLKSSFAYATKPKKFLTQSYGPRKSQSLDFLNFKIFSLFSITTLPNKILGLI